MKEINDKIEEIKKYLDPRLSALEQLVNKLLQQHMGPPKELMTLDEVADYLDSSRSQIYKLSSSKKIPHYCPNGKRLFFRRSQIDQWAFSNKQTSKDEITQQAEEYLAKKVRR